MVEFARIKPEDTLITLGDLVDRGPDTKGVLNWVINRHQAGNTISLLGNHELMMMRSRFSTQALADWLRFGGRETLISYGSEELSSVPKSHWDFFDNICVDFQELEKHFCVHATAHHSLELREQPELFLFWEKIDVAPRPHKNGKIMICGHTAQKSGLPFMTPTTICLDTWCYGGGWLTALEVETGRLFQTRDNGEKRTLNYLAPIEPPRLHQSDEVVGRLNT